MAWFGRIEDFKRVGEKWQITVAYYDDANPAKTISRALDFPLTVTKALVVQKIRSVGAEVRATSVLNADNSIVGSVISIP